MPTDAVAQARIALDRLYEATAGGDYDVSAYCEARDALIAALLAECVAKVRALTPVAYIDLEDGAITEHDGRHPAVLLREALAALEAKP